MASAAMRLPLLLGALLLPGALAPSAWFFRPRTAAGAIGTQNGSSYATAWTSSAAIEWSRIQPGDTLFVCGLHDSGRADGALNLTRTQGSGTAAAPVVIDGACEDEAGRADPGTLMSAHPVPHSQLGQPSADGIFTYSYPTPARASAGGGRLGATTGMMANKPDVLELPGGGAGRVGRQAVAGGAGIARLKHAECGPAGPTDPSSWAPGSACYSGVWTNRTTVSSPPPPPHPPRPANPFCAQVYYKPSAGVSSATIYLFEYDMPSAVNGWPPLSFHYAEHVVAQNLTLQGPAWELVAMVGGHHVGVATSLLRWASYVSR